VFLEFGKAVFVYIYTVANIELGERAGEFFKSRDAYLCAAQVKFF